MKTTVTVDRGGRLSLPKAVREAIGVFGRTEVEVEVVGSAARITTAIPGPRTATTSRGDRRAIFNGPLPRGWDSGKAVQRMRERRGK